MAGETILFFVGVIEEARPGARIVGSMTIFAAIGGNGVAGGMRPRVVARAVPGFVG